MGDNGTGLSGYVKIKLGPGSPGPAVENSWRAAGGLGLKRQQGGLGRAPKYRPVQTARDSPSRRGLIPDPKTETFERAFFLESSERTVKSNPPRLFCAKQEPILHFIFWR